MIIIFQLEWNMKLWWVHNETLIAFLMAYKETKDPSMLDNFATMFDYCYTKVRPMLAVADKHINSFNPFVAHELFYPYTFAIEGFFFITGADSEGVRKVQLNPL